MDRFDVVLDRYSEMREVLRSDAFGPDSEHPRTPLFDSTLLLLSAAAHRSRRRREMQLFGRSAIRVLNREVLRPSIRAGIRSALPEGTGRVCVDLVPLLHTMMYKLAAAVTGIDLDDDPDDVARFISLQERFAQGGSVTYDGPDTEQRLADSFAAREEFRVRFFEPSLTRRKELLAGCDSCQGGPRDVLTILLSAEEPLPEETMLSEAMLYFAASTGNTARMVPHCLSDLWAWRSLAPTAEIPRDSTFLHAAAAETLRLHPSSPLIYRRATRDVTLSSGTLIPFGALVRMDVGAANRDPEFFSPDPDRFDPYRRTPPDRRPWGMTFGDGAHKCVGEGMAAGSPAGDGQRADGVIPIVLESLFEFGVEPDPDRKPKPRTVARYSYYEAFPVMLSAC